MNTRSNATFSIEIIDYIFAKGSPRIIVYYEKYETYVQKLGFTYTTNVVENMYIYYREFFSPIKGFFASNLFVNSDTLHTNFAKVANVYIFETYYTQTKNGIEAKEKAYELINEITLHMLVKICLTKLLNITMFIKFIN